MNSTGRYLALLALATLGGSFALACGGDDGRNGGTGTPGGGQGNGAGGTGNDTGGSGGSGGTTGAGGHIGAGGNVEGAGGTGNALGFVCPSGFEGMKPTLPGVESPVSPLAEGPATGDNRFLEGPVWDGTYLYVSQIRDYGPLNPSRILRLEGEDLVPFIPDARAGTNGLAVRDDGKLVAATHRVHGITLIDPSSPDTPPEIVIDEYNGAGFNSPNDLTLHSNGSIYFTDPDWQCGEAEATCPQGAGNNRVYRVLPNGAVEATEPPHSKPNGIALSLDEDILYVAGNDAGIHAYTLDASGAIGTSSEFSDVRDVDGMTLDCAGNLYVTVHPQGRIDVFTPQGELHGSIKLSGGTVTNVAFGGADRKTLYITGGPNLYAVELDIPGLPY